MSGGWAETEGDTESESGSRLWAVNTEPNAGLELMNCETMTWASQTLNQLSHPGAPNMYFFNVYLFLRDRVWAGHGSEREWDTESEAGSGLRAVSTEPEEGLQLTSCEMMTWASQTLNQLSHPGAPITLIFYNEHMSFVENNNH